MAGLFKKHVPPSALTKTQASWIPAASGLFALRRGSRNLENQEP